MTIQNWHQYREKVKLDGRHWINGKRVDSVDGSTIDKETPIDGSHLLSFSRGKEADINLAVSSAVKTFNSGVWSNLAPSERKKILLRFAQIIEDNRDELAILETLDMGKPIHESLNTDVAAAVNCFRWFAEAIDKIYGEVAPTGNDALAYIIRQPIGIIGVIIPWNYPLIMLAWKLAPALAAGNTVVVKPSERSPLTALRVAELAKEAMIPDGVVNVVAGFGHEAGEALALHQQVGAIGFTGSTAIGKKMLVYSGQSNLKRVYNELGGKSPIIVFNDYQNLDRAASIIAGSMFYNQGQSCNAPSRVFVHDHIADELSKLLVEKAALHIPADPLLDSTQIGAMVDKRQMETVLSYIASGNQEGANCLVGGTQSLVGSGGYYVKPTIFDHVKPQMKIAREEIFGPVLSLFRFKDEAEVVSLANDTAYGLQAGVWSDNVNRVHRVARQIQAGTVHINQYGDDNILVPFGGVKQSGNGRDKSLHALDKYTELKTIWLKVDE